MEGRWTVYLDRDGREVTWPTRTAIPVVPCDDAAIERVARVLFEDYSSEYDTTWEQDRDAFMTAAKKVLRAAGETP